MNKITVIITAGGSGVRMGTEVKKQYLELDNMPVLARTIDVFDKMDEVNGIFIVCPADDIHFVRENIVNKYGYQKIEAIVAGGKERQDSVFNGLKSVSLDKDAIIVIHDAVRPFISTDTVRYSIQKAEQYGASVVGVKPKDTIKTLQNEQISGTLNRNELFSVQTPQSFRAGLIINCYERAFADGYFSTDDSALVEKYSPDTVIACVDGGYFNFKITTVEDMVFAKAVLDFRKKK